MKLPTKNERLRGLISEILAERPGATVDQILDGARARGYRSRAKTETQRAAVGRVLSGLARRRRARRVQRGQYAAKA